MMLSVGRNLSRSLHVTTAFKAVGFENGNNHLWLDMMKRSLSTSSSSSSSSSGIGIKDMVRRMNPLAQKRNIEMGERLFRAAQLRSNDLHWYVDGRVSTEFRARHAMLTLHVWFLHKRLIKEDSLWLQEELFDILWNDTKSRIRAVDGIHELTVNKHLKDVQQVTFQHCTHLDHATTLPLGTSERFEEFSAAIWMHILLRRDDSAEDPRITEQVLHRMVAYIEYQYDNIVHQLPKEYFMEGRIAWGELPDYSQMLLQGKKVEPRQYDGPSSDLTLPPQWKQALTDAGDAYYWNMETNETQWEVPTTTAETSTDTNTTTSIPSTS